MANKNYRNLLIGDGLSAFGSWIDFLAILAMYCFSDGLFIVGKLAMTVDVIAGTSIC